MVVKEKRSILENYWFEILASTVMLTRTQNRNYLLILLGACHILIWNLGSHESNGSSGLQSRVEMREIWSNEARLCKVDVDIVTSTLSQNRGYFYLFDKVKSYMVLRFRNSRIQRFKWIAIRSWNKWDMVNRNNTTQKTLILLFRFY